ncbi:MAG: DUF3990 domain-containing protein [Prevotellaceae bacterium]|jgi:hypothetical protein|nr:DUF3990 domain-containing protein [Prevotellaceae bacterium]
MRVFHGSDALVPVIDLQKCRPNRDFGRSFYVTQHRSQAEAYATFFIANQQALKLAKVE